MIYVLLIFLLTTAPAAGLFMMTRKLDKKEPESKKLLLKIVLMELPFILATIIAEAFSEASLSLFTGSDMQNPLFIFVMCFFVIGPAEELFKLLGAAIPTWKSREFNCRFDGIVYCTTSALTFSLIENITYLFTSKNALVTAFMRAVCCFPGHFMYGVLMGVFYSRARIAANKGNRSARNLNFFLAVLIPSLIHGLYDTLSFNVLPVLNALEGSSGSGEAVNLIKLLLLLIGLLMVVGGTYITLFVVIFRQSKTDYFIAPAYPQPIKPVDRVNT